MDDQYSKKLKNELISDLTDKYIQLSRDSIDPYTRIEKTLLHYFANKRYGIQLSFNLLRFNIISCIEVDNYYYFKFTIELINRKRIYTFNIDLGLTLISIANAGQALHINSISIT